MSRPSSSPGPAKHSTRPRFIDETQRYIAYCLAVPHKHLCIRLRPPVPKGLGLGPPGWKALLFTTYLTRRQLILLYSSAIRPVTIPHLHLHALAYHDTEMHVLVTAAQLSPYITLNLTANRSKDPHICTVKISILLTCNNNTYIYVYIYVYIYILILCTVQTNYTKLC